jgi:2,3-bisphosphoglycerate-independent phosphoglycerate mutase
MGNSEVGHNILGAGRSFAQGATLVQAALRSGELFRSETWRWLMEPLETGGTLHLLGLWSDGNVHSHLDHAYSLLDAVRHKLPRARVRLHLLLDGRDVGEQSALEYLEPAEHRFAEFREAGFDVRICSGGGRMVTTMDRYQADWRIVERGWRAHVLGQGRQTTSALEAVRAERAAHPQIIDQDLAPFVVAVDGRPVGTIEDGDAVICFNFRGDRAIEITHAFETPEGAFPHFDRERVPKVRYAGMMQYDGDLQLPARFLVSPPAIDHTLGELLARQGVRQLAVSETQKFGHVTYFFNGNNSGKFNPDLERYVEIPSDRVNFAERPWMKAAEITDAVLFHLDDFRADFVRVNYPNGDMVGHTGNLQAARLAMEAVDLCTERLVAGVLARGGICILTADHGNCDEMIERDKKTGALRKNERGGYRARTSHTTNPVPCAILGGGAGARFGWDRSVGRPALANLAATCLALLGLEAPADYEPPLVAPTR